MKKIIIPFLIGNLLSFSPHAFAETFQSSHKCLADNLYHEARGEGEKGMKYVGHVTLNRVKSKRYPNTVCGVVYQRNQFSWTRNKPAIKEKKAYSRARAIARALLKRDESKTHFFGATYFHATHVRPTWASSKKVVMRHGNHVFLR